VAGEVVEVVFLLEDVVLREFFAAGESPEKDRNVDLGGELGAASGVHGVGFALAALLGTGERRRREEGTNSRHKDGKEGTTCRAPTRGTRIAGNSE